jgi:ABC-type transporter Mla maintaining outer membrane lipid asymmetry permease subunit MlaE
VIAPVLGQCRRALVEAGPAVVAAGALVAFAVLGGGAEGPSAWPREAAPLVAALVACGPLAAARAGELARWRQDAQIDALRAMGGSAFRHLIAPRLVAGALALPLLVLLADAAGLGVAVLGWAPRAERWAATGGVAGSDVVAGLARGALFGAALAGVACVAGLASPRPGADGAARCAPRAVARAAGRAGAGGVVAVLGLHVALGGGFAW